MDGRGGGGEGEVDRRGGKGVQNYASYKPLGMYSNHLNCDLCKSFVFSVPVSAVSWHLDSKCLALQYLA